MCTDLIDIVLGCNLYLQNASLLAFLLARLVRHPDFDHKHLAGFRFEQKVWPSKTAINIDALLGRYLFIDAGKVDGNFVLMPSGTQSFIRMNTQWVTLHFGIHRYLERDSPIEALFIFFKKNLLRCGVQEVVIPTRSTFMAEVLFSNLPKDSLHFKSTARTVKYMFPSISIILKELIINSFNVNSVLAVVYPSISILNIFSHSLA